MHASNLTQIVEEAQMVNDHKLSELEKKFEVVLWSNLECMDQFKRHFLNKINVFCLYL